MSFSQWIAEGLQALAVLVTQVGMPLAILAWVALLAGVLLMHRRLLGEDTGPHRTIAGAVGGIALLAHLLDFVMTLTITPDLAMETSPLWVVVIDSLGYQVALLYGLTGKALIVVLSYQLFTWYRIQRVRLFPPPGSGSLRAFVQAFGGTHLNNLGNFLSFAFPLLSPLMFYVVLLNSTDSIILTRLPPLPAVVLVWLLLLPVAYFQLSHRAWQAQ